MRLPDYVMMNNSKAFKRPMILQTQNPHMVGRVMAFRSYDAEAIEKMESDIVNERCIGIKVEGYSVWLIASGSMTNQYIDREYAKEILLEMREFFMEEQITAHPYSYQRSQEGYVKKSDR